MNLGSRAMVGKERWVGYPLPEAGHVHDDTPYGDCHPHYRVTEGRSQAQAPFARDWISLIIVIVNDIPPTRSSCRLFDITAIVVAAVSRPLSLFGPRLLILIIVEKLFLVVIIGWAVGLLIVTVNDEAIVERVAFVSAHGVLKILVRLFISTSSVLACAGRATLARACCTTAPSLKIANGQSSSTSRRSTYATNHLSLGVFAFSLSLVSLLLGQLSLLLLEFGVLSSVDNHICCVRRLAGACHSLSKAGQRIVSDGLVGSNAVLLRDMSNRHEDVAM
ncbi:hypothetical protein HG531_002287 [Fusarium graminearum]|nr:hypothetical protein HG531_002287 [Fusarium graminearum]